MQERVWRLFGVILAVFCLFAPASAKSESPFPFSDYVSTFNAGDLSFVDYYVPDIVFDKGPEGGVLRGRQAIAQWYADAWRDFDETLTPLTVAIDRNDQVMMVELRTELVARHDGIVWRGRTYAKNDRLIVDGTIVYGLRNGLISSIRGAAEGRKIIPAAASGEGN